MSLTLSYCFSFFLHSSSPSIYLPPFSWVHQIYLVFLFSCLHVLFSHSLILSASFSSFAFKQFPSLSCLCFLFLPHINISLLYSLLYLHYLSSLKHNPHFSSFRNIFITIVLPLLYWSFLIHSQTPSELSFLLFYFFFVSRTILFIHIIFNVFLYLSLSFPFFLPSSSLSLLTLFVFFSFPLPCSHSSSCPFNFFWPI